VHTDFFNPTQSAVTYATTAAEVILLVRLTWLGLLREFKIFSLFLTCDVICTMALMRLDYHSYGYEWIWALSSPVWTVLLAAASLELSRGLVQPMPQETGNRKVALCGFLLGITVSAVASMLTHPEAISRSAVLFTLITRRSILSGCILAILAQGTYLTLGGAPICRNWRLHRRALLTCMTVTVMTLFAATSKQREYVDWIDLLRAVSVFGCVCVWIIGLRRAFSDLWDGVEWPPTEEQIADNLAFARREAVLSRKRGGVEGLESWAKAKREV